MLTFAATGSVDVMTRDRTQLAVRNIHKEYCTFGPRVFHYDPNKCQATDGTSGGMFFGQFMISGFYTKKSSRNS
jgi:acyl dehydratase